ncbi:TPA: DUF4255 domain-containing protein [Enterobacter bugandensis]|nr:DUF4255 domain-containing protein [Enterobacter bugandensis]
MFFNNDQPNEISVLNQKISEYIKDIVGDSIALRFDAPDPDVPVDQPTLHLFLYLIHEALDVKHAEGRVYDPATGKYIQQYGHVRCLYLVTYWEKTSTSGVGSPGTLANSEHVIHLNNLARALLAMRSDPQFKDYLVRVIEPEALNSLGNFWQALGNKPRTIINFAVTLPVAMPLTDEGAGFIAETQLVLAQGSGNWVARAEKMLLNKLKRGASVPANAVDHLVVKITVPPENTLRTTPPVVDVLIAGVAFKDDAAAMKNLYDAWVGTIIEQDDQRISIKSVNDEGLVQLPRPARG